MANHPPPHLRLDLDSASENSSGSGHLKTMKTTTLIINSPLSGLAFTGRLKNLEMIDTAQFFRDHPDYPKSSLTKQLSQPTSLMEARRADQTTTQTISKTSGKNKLNKVSPSSTDSQ